MSILASLAPAQPLWTSWAWLATADLRLLWAILAAAAAVCSWGLVVGWRAR